METIEFESEVTIPVTVVCTAFPETGDGWNEPRMPAHVELQGIRLPKDVMGYIFKTYGDVLVEEAEESLR